MSTYSIFIFVEKLDKYCYFSINKVLSEATVILTSLGKILLGILFKLNLYCFEGPYLRNFFI